MCGVHQQSTTALLTGVVRINRNICQIGVNSQAPARGGGARAPVSIAGDASVDGQTDG